MKGGKEGFGLQRPYNYGLISKKSLKWSYFFSNSDFLKTFSIMERIKKACVFTLIVISMVFNEGIRYRGKPYTSREVNEIREVIEVHRGKRGAQ